MRLGEASLGKIPTARQRVRGQDRVGRHCNRWGLSAIQRLLERGRTIELFSAIMEGKPRRWRFNQSPLFLQFLMGKRDFECTPWGNPLYTIFGWQRPCYLLQDGYAATFHELMEDTQWEQYGRSSGNPSCQDCMVHCGYEPSAVEATFGTWRGFRDTAAATITGRL